MTHDYAIRLDLFALGDYLTDAQVRRFEPLIREGVEVVLSFDYYPETEATPECMIYSGWFDVSDEHKYPKCVQRAILRYLNNTHFDEIEIKALEDYHRQRYEHGADLKQQEL